MTVPSISQEEFDRVKVALDVQLQMLDQLSSETQLRIRSEVYLAPSRRRTKGVSDVQE